MATSCPIGFDAKRLREQVTRTYARVATDPASGFHFEVGPRYAVEVLGYPREDIESLPASCVARFAGVGNPHCIGDIVPGSVVLDHACGAGVDLLLAARRVGPAGRAIGVDLTPAMCRQAAQSAREAGLAGRVEIREGIFEALPANDSSVDYLISNGVVNLTPDKPRVFAEIARVLRPGGQLHLADVAVSRELSPAVRADADLWAACVGGAVTEAELGLLAAGAGLVGGRVVRRFNCFRNTRLAHKFHGRLDVYAVAFHAVKPPAALS